MDIDTPPIIQMIFYIGDFIYNLSYLLFSILLILVWGLKSNNKRIKKQSEILVITSIIPFGLNLLTQTIFPLVTHIELPKIGQIYSIITITGIYIVVTKYKFLKLPKNFIFEEVMNEMLDMVIIVNDQGEIIEISKNTLNILGYTERELLEEKLDFIIDKNDRKRISLEKVKERNFNTKNLKMLRKNGHILPVNLSCKQIMDSKLHEFLGAIIIFQDMSLVYELKRVNTEIFNEKERFKITLLSVADGVISTDIKGNIQFINKVGEQLTGWTYEEAVNKPIEDVFNIINEFTREKCKNSVHRVIELGEIIGVDSQKILVAKDGCERPIEDSAAPIRDENGKISDIVLVFRDYSARKEERKRIEYLSYHDQLTGLYNRRFYEEELNRLDIERNLPLTIVMADVNGLKLINDSFGHTKGDELLKKVTKVITKGCRADDIIARLGGDEFVILLPKTNTCEAAQIVKRIRSLAAQEDVDSIKVSISFGYETKMDKSKSIEDIIKKAEDYMYQEKLFESQGMRGNTVKAIINTLNEKNQREEQHADRVSKFCMSMGEALQLPDHQVEVLRSVGLLHDIGKIAISEDILNKPGSLKEEEWKEIKRHPEIGYRILSSVNDLSDIANYVLCHHERWDGKGYPKGLKEREIPFISRIITIVDAYDAMTSERSYRKAFSDEVAITEIKDNAGTQFDPELVNVFTKKVMAKT